jgi:hypothetical protein
MVGSIAVMEPPHISIFKKTLWRLEQLAIRYQLQRSYHQLRTVLERFEGTIERVRTSEGVSHRMKRI